MSFCDPNHDAARSGEAVLSPTYISMINDSIISLESLENESKVQFISDIEISHAFIHFVCGSIYPISNIETTKLYLPLSNTDIDKLRTALPSRQSYK